MKTFQFLILPLLILCSHFTSFLTYTVIKNIKTGEHIVPLLGWHIEGWMKYITISLAFLQPLYWVAGVLLFFAYKLSLDFFKDMYPAVILNLAIITLMTVVMMYWRVKEIPSRDGWIALALVFIASFLAMNAGKGIGPR